MPSRLLVFPDDTARSLIDALNGAQQSVNIRMFLFTDPDMLAAVQAASGGGGSVPLLVATPQVVDFGSSTTTLTVAIENRDPVADPQRFMQVVGDEEKRHAEALLSMH